MGGGYSKAKDSIGKSRDNAAIYPARRGKGELQLRSHGTCDGNKGGTASYGSASRG